MTLIFLKKNFPEKEILNLKSSIPLKITNPREKEKLAEEGEAEGSSNDDDFPQKNVPQKKCS